MTTDSEWLHDPAGLAALRPSGFALGVATSAFQIEGAVREDGRGESAWDTFMAQSGRILDASSAAVTADHYHRVGEDLRLLSELGVDSYRFSIGWPRLQPGGRGGINRTAAAFYDRLVDGLLEAGIRPIATLYHWDTPEPLQHLGGWLNRDTAYRLADYAFIAGEAFGDRVDSWVTMNEPATVTIQGYGVGAHAPGATLGLDALPAAHHQLLAHGLAVEALRAADVRGGIGIANLHSPAEPASDHADDATSAALLDLLLNRLFAEPVLFGRYPDAPEEVAHLVSALDEVDPADLAIISKPIDFYGLNYYGPTRTRAARSGDDPAMRALGFALAPWPEFPTTGYGWPNAPEYLGAAIRELGERYGRSLPPVVITEGGASYPDTVDERGAVDDAGRASYLAEHLAVAFAGAPEVELRGYLVRSLLDGWEWTAGFTQPFGLVHVDRTGTRTPKRSYRWFQNLIRAGSS